MKKSLFLLSLFVFSACENYEPTNRDIGAAGGAALGAGLGAIVGNQVGDPGAGVAVGAVAGGLVGGIIGDAQDVREASTNDQDEMLRRQEKELERQRRELEDLRRQQLHDDSYQNARPSYGGGSRRAPLRNESTSRNSSHRY